MSPSAATPAANEGAAKPNPVISGVPPVEPFAEIRAFLRHIGRITLLIGRMFRTLFTTRFETWSYVYQVEQLGVRSLAIACATAVFVGMVMTLQFAYFAEKYGAQEALGRIISLSEARELAPALTSLVVGCRISAGMAAELGSMAVTEQIDAIRALGADPIRKLVVPRVMAGITVIPLMCVIAFLLGMISSMMVAWVSYGVSPATFRSAALDVLAMKDLGSGFAKTPFFGFLITIVGCHFGMETHGGTEGVGRSTTSSVVVAAITLLIADALLTQIFLSI